MPRKTNRSLRRRRGEGDLNYLFRVASRAPAALRQARAKAAESLEARKKRLDEKQEKEREAFNEEFRRKEADFLAKREREHPTAYHPKRINPKTGRFY